MAGSGHTEALLAKLESKQTNKLQKLIALERLSEECENGFSADDIDLMLRKIPTFKGVAFAVQLLDCCLPASDISLATIDRAVFIMAGPHTTPTLKRALLGWLLAGVQQFLPAAGRRHLRTHYGALFAQIASLHVVNLACTLLYLLTELSDAQQHRVDMLVSLSAGVAADSGPCWALIRKYHQLRPDLVQRHAGPDGQTRWEKPRAQLTANLQRWARCRDGAGAAASAAAGGGGGGGGGSGDSADFWDMCGKTSRRGPALAVLPESVPAAGGGQPDRWRGCRDLASLGSLQDVATEGTLGFREANNLTALALSSRRRTALLLSANRERDAMQMSQELLVTLRQMLVYEPRRFLAPRRRHLLRQLHLCQRVGLPLSAGRHLMRTLLEGARPEQSQLWLPALDLLPFYGWRPHAVLQQTLLRPLEALVMTADRHARLHVLHLLTEFITQLARHDLPLVLRRAFPYTSQTYRDEISTSGDPAVDVARVAEQVAILCKRLSTSGPPAERMNLLRATVHFYTEVTPALLEAGVPYLPVMGKDLVYQVLLGADVVAVNKLMLVFSRYREQSARLVALQSAPAVSRVRLKLAGATAARLQASTGVIEDVLRLLFSLRKGGGGQFAGLTADVRARLRTLMQEQQLELDLHPALISYQQLAETQPDFQEEESNQQLLLNLVSADGLVGFAAFREACMAAPRRRR